MKVYCISGLGADERAFAALHFNRPVVHVKWLTPFKKESLTSYCKRLIEQIDTSEDFILLGVSFGGMLACEFNKYIHPKHTIIISSAAQASELPWLYKVMGRIRLANWLPTFMLLPPSFVLPYLFGIKDPAQKLILQNISRDTDLVFLRWAVGEITRWKNTFIPPHLLRIHGDKDKVLPALSPDAQVIKGGGHFMIIDRANEISALINKY
ncbi:MAG: hypothetical protein JWO58_2173 [Chitinophagaceae bacterium]|nr:hypothetical protein [Chitinophagaceae bacterium]